MGIFTRSDRNSASFSAAQTQSIYGVSIDPAVFGLTSWDGINNGGRVTRKQALSVPAVKRARDIICGSIGTLPLDCIGPGKQEKNWFFAQPEKFVPVSVTLTRTAEDLLFDGVAYWRVVESGWDNYPTSVERIDVARVSRNEDGLLIDGRRISDDKIIVFTSPNAPLSESGARAVRTLLLLDSQAATFADGVPPMGILSPEDGYVLSEDDKTEVPNAWREARKKNGTALLSGLKYTPIGWSPEQLQLVEARQHAVLDIARLTGIDPEELGVSTTSRTYSNQYDRRKAFLDFTQAAYRLAISQRLSFNDASPRGYSAVFNLSAFLRSDDLTRQQVYALALANGALTHAEVRVLEDRPALTPSEQAAIPAPAPAAQEGAA